MSELDQEVVDQIDEEVGESSEELDVMYGEKNVRWYQLAAQHGVEKALACGVKRILLEMPTGVGKTLTSGLIFGSPVVRKELGIADGVKLRLLFIAHKHRLLTQAENSFADANLVEFIPHSAFQEIPDDLEWDISCIDEAHHEAMATIQYRLDMLGRKPIIGLTATPDRADGCLIKFEEIINPISREEAVAQGFLAETYLNSIMDSPHADKAPITKMFLDQYVEEFGQTMMFFRTKKEVREVTDYLASKGKRAIAILQQGEKAVDEILNAFSAGAIQFVVNCNKINEGVDCKGVTDVYLGRAYGSYPQLNQVIGRAARPDSDCRVWELINPLSGRNLDTTVVVGTPKKHRLISRRKGTWLEQEFDYVSHMQEIGAGRSYGG